MSILDKNKCIIANISTRKVKSDSIEFYNTDENTSHVYIRFKYQDVNNNMSILPYSETKNFSVELNIVSPKKVLTIMQGTFIESENVFAFDLPKNLTNRIGEYACELIVSLNEDKITFDYFKYVIKGSILTGLSIEIENDPNLSILEQLINEVKELQKNAGSGGGTGVSVDLTEYQKKTDNNLRTKDKSITGAINELVSILNPFGISSFSINKTIAEMGSSNNIILNWSYNDEVISQTLNNTNLNISLRTYQYQNVTSNTVYTLKGISQSNQNSSKSVSITFYNGIYYGVSSNMTYDSDLITSFNSSKILSNSRSRTITVNAGSNQYIYYCIPSRLGTPTFKVGGFEGGFELVNTLSYTNNYNYTENYNIYKSANDNLGSTTITIS